MKTHSADQPPMGNMLQFLVSCYFWTEMFLLSAILTPLAVLIFLLTVWFDQRSFIQHKFNCLWSFIVLGINPAWRIEVTGREKIDPRQTYIIVSNHQSGADIIVLFLLWTHFKWIAKRSLFNYPFIGWNMSLARYISLEREKPSSMKRMMLNASKAIRKKNSLMVFPEGTRSKDGTLQPFKSGAFHLAIDNRVPIVPIVITGTSKAIRKGGFLINRNYKIRAKVLDPIPYAVFEHKTPKELGQMVHEMIEGELNR